MKKLKDILKESLGELPSSKLMKMKHNPLKEGKFREGDIVVPSVGAHKGVKHTANRIKTKSN